MDEKKKIGVREILVGALAFVVLFSACLCNIRRLTVHHVIPGTDWIEFQPTDWQVYMNAAKQLLRGHSPYQIPGHFQFYNPPWMLVLYVPFTFIPYPYSLALFMSVGFIVHLLLYRHYNSNLVSLVFYLLSAPVALGLLMGQLDWAVLVGLLLPPQYGLFLISAKPQIGCVVMLIWLIEAYQEKRVVRTFLPVSVAFGLSFLAFGLWPLNWMKLAEIEPMWGWPYVLLLGVPLLLQAIKKRDTRLAMCAGPLLSPHTLMHSWCGGMLKISHPLAMATFSVCTWIIAFVSAILF